MSIRQTLHWLGQVSLLLLAAVFFGWVFFSMAGCTTAPSTFTDCRAAFEDSHKLELCEEAVLVREDALFRATERALAQANCLYPRYWDTRWQRCEERW